MDGNFYQEIFQATQDLIRAIGLSTGLILGWFIGRKGW